MRQPVGEITPSSLYTIKELRSRCNLGDFVWRQIRHSGLRIRRVGRRQFVYGQDFITFVLQAPETSAADVQTEQKPAEEAGE